jgi:hypothetical protein
MKEVMIIKCKTPQRKELYESGAKQAKQTGQRLLRKTRKQQHKRCYQGQQNY